MGTTPLGILAWCAHGHSALRLSRCRRGKDSMCERERRMAGEGEARSGPGVDAEATRSLVRIGMDLSRCASLKPPPEGAPTEPVD